MKLKIGLLFAVLAAAVLCWLWGRKGAGGAGPPGAAKEATAVAQRGDLKIVVLAQGKISAKKSEKISHSNEGALTIATLVPEGKEVAKDEELVVFDNAKQKQEVEAAEAACKSSATDVEIAAHALEIGQRENAETLSQAQFKLNAAKLELEKCEKGDLPQTERKDRLDIEKAESALKQAQESYKSVAEPEALKQGFVTPLEIEEKRLAVRSAEMGLELANSELELFKTYTSRVTLSTKHADEDAARANAATVEAVNTNKAQTKQAELQAKQELLRLAKNRLTEARKNLEGTVLKAPTAGVVLYGDPDEPPWRSNDAVRVGGQVFRNMVIVTLPKMDELMVKTTVSETDITKLAVGTQAIITSDAYPDLKETGTVSKIGNVAKRNWWMDATNNYEVEIELKKINLHVKPGVSTKVEIQAKELKDVLKIPLSAVFNNEGRNIVYVKTNSIAAREIKIGNASDTHIAVTEGLQEGETVLLYEPENVPLPPKSEPAAAPVRKDVLAGAQP
ncbi:MAG: HlyD family efflux transporter periplasmic adaptor subunit [Planctomycetota bacterium]